MKSSDLSGFTSGVVTIAATIMVLQLTTADSGNWKALTDQWQTFIGHYNSFFLIYILWYNHAKEFSKVEYIKPDLVIFNGIWLIFLALIPFATSWVEHYPNYTAPEISFAILWIICIFISGRMNVTLYRENPETEFSIRLNFKYRLPIYIALAVALINAFIIPFLNVFIYLIITIYMTILILHTREKDVTII